MPWIVAQNILNDWADYDLPAPPPDDEWVRYGPDLLEIDTGDGEIEDVIYGFFTEDTTDEAAQDPEEVPEPEPQPVSAEPPAAPISVSPNGLYNIGIAWSPSGAWAIRVGSTDEEAIANAIAACNAAANGGCTDSGVSVSDVTPFCYAIVGGGGSIFAARNAQAGNAVATAMQNCQASGNGDCAVQAADCNTHP